jgi:phosphomannomutase
MDFDEVQLHAHSGASWPYPVVSISELNGTKFLLENDNWALLRFSGTEPLLRLFAEADSAEKAKELIESLKALVSL